MAETGTEIRKPRKYSQEWAESEEGKAALAAGDAQWKVLRWFVWPLVVVMVVIGSATKKPTETAAAASASASASASAAPTAHAAPAAWRSCRRCVYDQTESMLKVGARELVRQKLRDPGSAIFDGQATWTDPEKPVIISRTADGGVRAVCGRVNAKNGFGGYADERVYIVDFEGDFVTADGTVEDMQSRCLRP